MNKCEISSLDITWKATGGILNLTSVDSIIYYVSFGFFVSTGLAIFGIGLSY